MTLQKVVKETNYSANFRERLGREKSDWLRQMRQKAFDYFIEKGFPTPNDEDWKYTNVAPIAKENFEAHLEREATGDISINAFNYEAKHSELAFINGVFNKKLSSVRDLTSCVVATNLEEAAGDEKFAAVIKENFARVADYDSNGFTALNTAFVSHGVFIFIPKNTKIESPIHIIFSSSESENLIATFPRIFIFAERGSEATIVENYTRTDETKYFTNSVVEIVLEDDAKLKHFRVQRESHNAFHVGTTAVNLNRASLYDSTNITLGGKLSRHDVNVKFNAEGGEAFVDGLYLVSEEQHADTHSIIDHAVPNCKSHQTYKGIVDEKARAVFNGKVFVRENASGTDAQQSNKNLLLSNDARVDTKPQLEIFNDDVKCSHGATVGQLEEEELFYLLSRGLNESLARNLLTYGFAEEIVNKIEIESIKKQLDEAVLNRLNANLEG
jgi:Fe-S cluster assembly protein SufD